MSNAYHDIRYGFSGVHGGCRVVRIAHEHQAGAGGGGDHLFEVQLPVRIHRHFVEWNLPRLRDARGCLEGRHRCDKAARACRERLNRILENLSGARSERDAFQLDAVFLRDQRAKVGHSGPRVHRVPPRIRECLLNRSLRWLRRADRILVAVQTNAACSGRSRSRPIGTSLLRTPGFVPTRSEEKRSARIANVGNATNETASRKRHWHLSADRSTDHRIARPTNANRSTDQRIARPTKEPLAR